MILFMDIIALWILALILTFGLVLFLKIKNKWCFGYKRLFSLTNSCTIYGWFASLLVLIVLFSSLFISKPSTKVQGSSSLSTHALMFSQIAMGEDNGPHMTLVKEINRSGFTTYFTNDNDAYERLYPGIKTYAQFPHVITAVTLSADDAFSSITYRDVSDTELLIESYIFGFNFFIAMSIGMMVGLALSFVRIFGKVSIFSALLLSAVGSLLAIIFFGQSIINYGFFSFAPVMIFMMMQANIELFLSSNDDEVNLVARTFLRLIPIMAIGHTWWLLLPASLGFFALMTCIDLFNLKAKFIQNALLVFAVSVIPILFSLIPAFILVFLTDVDVSEATNSGGAIKYISVRNILVATFISVLAILSFYLFGRYKKNNMIKKTSRSLGLCIATFALFVLAYSLYQIKTLKHFDYNGYKLGWALAWLPLAVFLLLFLLIVNYVLTGSYSKSNILKVGIFAIISIAVLSTSVSHYRTYRAQYATNLSGPIYKQNLDEMIKAVDKSSENNQYIIVLTDCSAYTIYFNQKLAMSLRGKMDEVLFSYMLKDLEKGKINRDERVLKVYKKLGAENIFYYDMTPTSFNSSPSERLLHKNAQGLRTKVVKISKSDTNQFCATENT